MNCRRPWHQRRVRRVPRHIPLNSAKVGSPRGIFFAFNLLGCLLAVLFGYMVVALVLVTAAVGGLACQLRKQTDLHI